jgi:putative toxin-antitoxin system antitoxin component (TIGR02293 family)
VGSRLSRTTSRGKNGAASGRRLKSAAESAVIERAVAVIGDEPVAMRWLGTPIRALGYATPVSLLHTPEGRDAVISVLGRLEHGVL